MNICKYVDSLIERKYHANQPVFPNKAYFPYKYPQKFILKKIKISVPKMLNFWCNPGIP